MSYGPNRTSSKLTPLKNSLIGIEGSGVPVKGALELLVVVGTPLKCVSLQQSFIMIDMALTLSRVRGVATSFPLLNLGSVYGIYLANVGRQENIVFCWKKMEWESPPSILVTRNPNWSQRLGTGTSCVKGRY